MTRDEAVAELRFVLADTVKPYSWSDFRLLNFLSLAQDQFCKDTGFFSDFVTYNITTAVNIDSYALDPRIIEVLDVWYLGTKLRHFYQAERVTLPPSPGQPIGWQSDQQTQKITFWPALDKVYTIPLRVWRKSLQKLSADGAEFEIPEDFHLACVEWAAYKALGDHDRELQDPVKAAEHLANYKIGAREGKLAFQRISGGMGDVIPNPLYVV